MTGCRGCLCGSPSSHVDSPSLAEKSTPVNTREYTTQHHLQPFWSFQLEPTNDAHAHSATLHVVSQLRWAINRARKAKHEDLHKQKGHAADLRARRGPPCGGGLSRDHSCRSQGRPGTSGRDSNCRSGGDLWRRPSGGRLCIGGGCAGTGHAQCDRQTRRRLVFSTLLILCDVMCLSIFLQVRFTDLWPELGRSEDRHQR